uniref:Coatomer subunit zeta n=1 Tax=Amazona collaria TaxID=241587 RepID=A0A8B9FAG2_9PSIT
MEEPSLYTVKALLVLDSLGQRLLAKLMLLSVLTCLLDALGHLLQKEVEKRWLLDNMEGTFLVVDEIVDRGVILESDPQQVVQRLSLRVRAPILLHGLPLSCLLPAPSSPSLPPRSPSQHPTASSSLTTCQAARSRRTQGTATNKQH